MQCNATSSSYWDMVSNVVSCKTLTRISKLRRAITYIIWRIEISNFIIYIGGMVGEEFIEFQCNESSC